MNNEVITVNLDKMARLEEAVNTLLSQNTIREITRQEEVKIVADFREKVSDFRKELDKERKEMTEPLDRSKKKIMEKYRNPLLVLDEAKKRSGNILLNWNIKLQQLQKEQQEKLIRQARAEEERKQKALDKRIEKAKEQGKTEKAEALEDKKGEIFVPVPTVILNTEKTEGISYREKWTGVVVDFALVDDSLKVINQGAVDRISQTTKGTRPEPGIVWKMEKVIVQRKSGS